MAPGPADVWGSAAPPAGAALRPSLAGWVVLAAARPAARRQATPPTRAAGPRAVSREEWLGEPA